MNSLAMADRLRCESGSAASATILLGICPRRRDHLPRSDRQARPAARRVPEMRTGRYPLADLATRYGKDEKLFAFTASFGSFCQMLF